MPTPDETIVRAALGQHDRGIRFRAAIASAWDTFKIKYPDRAWWRRKSTRAGLMWEHSVDNSIESLQDDKGVKPVSHHDTMSFILDDLVLVRIKKASIELRSSNVQTVLASLFHRHDVDMFGETGFHRVEAAYVMNRFETEVAWIGIVARESKRKLLSFELNELGVSGQVSLFPAATKKSTADLVKVKLPAEPKKEDKGSE